jgi:hypothetical protein
VLPPTTKPGVSASRRASSEVIIAGSGVASAMEENPYAPPLHSTRTLSESQAKARSVAIAQRIAIICFLMYFFCGVAWFLPSQDIRYYVAVAGLVDVLVLFMSVFFLSIKLLNKFFNIGFGFLLIVVILLPPLAFILLLLVAMFVNLKATKLLRANGYVVGFFGATPSSAS